MQVTMMIDPPAGWRYGFPKVLHSSIKGELALAAWLVDNGYPEEDVDLALKHSRMWEQEV